VTASPRAGADDGTGLVVDAHVRRGGFDLRVALAVAPGEVLAVLGPNGAGKTTLLRALAGLTGLTGGSIHLDGTLLDDGADVLVPAPQRRVGLVFQGYRLFPHLDVRDNVAFSARAGGASRRESRRVADDWLDRLELGGLAGRRPDQLSGGQAQRVALARALASQPRLLLLDEPLAALDARTRMQVRASLRRHLVEAGRPVLVVTHDPVEAMVMADRLLVVEDGRVVQQGTPAQVARRPATDYVARLVGLNLWAGRLEAPGSVALDDGGRFAVVASAPGEQRLMVAVRPSAVNVHTSQPLGASARNVWPGVVDGIEPIADRVRLHVQGAPSALVDVTAAAVAELGLRPGSAVWLSVKATELEVYPRG
jgi:molybdate transport system ATP-binding protein